jgi:dimethylamine--corrinoid protein Co-methyltransferase
MKDLREDLNIGTTQSRPNAGVGIQTKFRIAELLGIRINSVEKFKKEAGLLTANSSSK